jgi:hypothetical protein
MLNALSLILRFGPLVAAALLGINGAFPGLDGLFAQLAGVLSLFGANPDPEFLQLVGEGTAGVLALIGVVRKGWSLIQKAISPA